jgi:hypothetical protein
MLDRLTRDGWVPYAKSIGTAAVAAVVLAVSAVRLVVLGEQVGTPEVLRWTLPVALDLGGVVATVVWTKSVGPASKWGMTIALLSLAESLAGNILSDLIDARLLPVTPLLVIGVGAVYPITLFLMIHLLVVSSGAKQARRPATRPEPRRAEAIREPAKPEAKAAPERKQIETAELHKVIEIAFAGNLREKGRAWFMEQVLTHGRDPESISGAKVDAAVGAKPGYMKRHVTGWRTEVLAATTAGIASAGN